MAQIIVGNDIKIAEFPFADEVHDMADFIIKYPQTLGADIQIVCKELQVGTTLESRRIDFLVFDSELNQVGIVELKNNLADEKVLLQALRYANWIKNNPDTVRYQIKKYNVDIDTEEIDTENIKVFIVAPKITQPLAELCQYISAFEFEFIEIQRFKDDKGQVYAVTNLLEIDTPETITSKPRSDYTLEWFQTQNVRPKQLDDLKQAIQKIETIIDEQGWELKVRYVKWAVRFQTAGGKNAFYIGIRKTQNHLIRIPLGTSFDLNSIKLHPEIKKKIKHKNPTSRWWSLSLEVSEINEYIPLFMVGCNSVQN
jgi:hypothetical protein